MGRENQKKAKTVHSLENELNQSIQELDQLLRLLEHANAEVAASDTKLKTSLRNFSNTFKK